MRPRAGRRIAGFALAVVLAACHPARPEKPRRLAVTLKVDGGFAYVPGLRRPISLDTADLPNDQARALDDLVRRADFFALPAAVGRPRPGAADVRTFELTVTGAAGAHTVRAIEPIGDPALEALIQRVQALAPAR